MRILLVGEYSGVHTNLSKSLRIKGYEVLTVHDGDSYKGFPKDIEIKYKYYSSSNLYIRNFFLMYYILIDFLGIKGLLQISFHINNLSKLKDYDVVQLINPIALEGFGSIVNILLIYFLKKKNKKVFLCALGDDYYWVSNALRDNRSMFNDINIKNSLKFVFSLRYKYGLFFPLLNKKAIRWSNKIIPGLYDYYRVYSWSKKCTDIIPIIVDSPYHIKPYKFNGYPIIIFHGWQEGKELRKGNEYFDRAIKSLPPEYLCLIKYKVIKNVAYEEYIKSFKESVIFFDQCFSYDKGVNALLGMAAGKVVFSGDQDGENSVCECLINALPNVENITEKLKELIDEPSKLEDISTKSLKYIRNRHNSDSIVNSYIKIWNS